MNTAGDIDPTIATQLVMGGGNGGDSMAKLMQLGMKCGQLQAAGVCAEDSDCAWDQDKAECEGLWR